MRFVKAHGTGNDFVVLPDWDDELSLSPQLVAAVCDRRRGIGADGVLRIVGSDRADVLMDHRNADGSPAEMCGNGVRVVAKHVVDHGLVRPVGGALTVATRAGVAHVTVAYGDDGLVAEVTVDLGPAEVAGVDDPVEVDGRAVAVTTVTTGNPHAVVVVDDVAAAPVTTLGPALERHPRFPNGTNVEFVAPTGDGTADVRVWERGVGETLACGTGAGAVLAALRALGLAGDGLVERWPGGELAVRIHDGGIQLTGAAVEVASGEIAGAFLAASS